ncbi:MAG: FlgD immunoglobulin-like domain containing protein [Candidatus Eisenbacteria bacterium]
MRLSRTLTATVLLTAAAAATIPVLRSRADRTPEVDLSQSLALGTARSGDEEVQGEYEGPEGGILENRGVPQGPFDPVLTVPQSPQAMVAPTNQVVNNRTGEQSGITQSEVSIAVQGNKVCVGWNDGQGFVQGGVTLSGFGYSTDRGNTFTDGGAVPNGPGTSVFGDPSLAVTNDGTWVFTSLDQGSPGGITVNRSTWVGNNLVWDPAINYSDQGASLDKEYLEYDTTLDRIYMSYVKFGGSSGGKITHSDDHGLTWAAPTTVNTTSANGYYPAVGIDGEVYVSWVEPLFQGNAFLYVRHSPDGGQTWSSNRVVIHQISPQAGGSPQCFNRGVNITWPSLTVDKSDGPFRGRVYAVYSDGGSNNYNVFVRYSDDKGQTWSAQTRLNDNANTSEQFWPQAYAGPDGRISVGWYDRRKASGGNSLCDFYVTQTVDGGQHWGPNRRMSDTSVAWCGVPSNVSPNFGDYVETICDDRSVFSVWSDGRLGDPDVVFGRIDDVQTLAVDATFGTAGAGNIDGVAWFIPNEAELNASPAPTMDSPADLLVASTTLALLATPQETDGIFQIGGDDLSGSLEFGSDDGPVHGTFALSRTGNNDLDVMFTADAGGDLVGAVLGRNISLDVTLANDVPGVVQIFGQATMSDNFTPPLVFAVAGTINLGSGASLPASQRLIQSASYIPGQSLSLHTRTSVEDAQIVDAPELPMGDNPPPLAIVRAQPNPWQPGAHVSFELSHQATGWLRVFATDGRVVRRLADGTFEPGFHEIAFDGRDDEGRELPAGGYYLRLETDAVSAAGKLIMVR